MTQKLINLGQADKGNGDPLRTAFSKVNENFAELYSTASADIQIPVQTNNGGKYLTTNGTTLSWATVAGGTADLDIYKFDFNTFGTRDNPDTGGWGGYNMYFDPGGESNAFISIPSVANQADGAGLQIFNRGAANSVVQLFGQANIQMVTGAGITEKVFRFEDTGTLTVPYPTSDSFRITLGSDNFVSRPGKATLTLTGTAWDFYGAFVYSQDGQTQLAVDSGPFPSLTNPGYEDGDTFEIDSTVHGIVGYTLTVSLSNVVQAGPAGWTASLAFSEPPVYPSTVKSLGAIKLTANTNSLILGTDGTVTVSGAIKQGVTKLNLNEGGGGNVYLTTTTDDTTALFMTSTGIQTFARESLSLYAGTTLAATEQLWAEVEQVWVDVRDQDAAIIAPATRPWAGLPSYQAYDIILNTFPVEPAAPGNLVPAANDAKNAYNTWQNALDNTSVGIGVGSGSWAFKPNGSFAVNNNEVHIATNNWGQTALANANTVVYTQKSNNDLASIRVHATIEGNEDGDATGSHTQACDMMIVRRIAYGGVSTVDSVVYGVIYTGTSPLATLDAQWNAVTNKIEITATPVSTTNSVFVKVYATEVARGD